MEADERAIFLDAIDIDDPAERLTFLDQACGDNAGLRSAIDQLLAAHDAPDHMLDRALVAQPDANAHERKSLADVEHSQPIQHIGMMIGQFRLMEQIGEGGFGLVFVAQQEQPVKRKVALKIIKPGTGSKEVIARFELERQALAMMDHPNIAQVFDAGVTDDARPYFVMELVRGLPITKYCDNYLLSIEERIRLFGDICAAVQHAHQKGVIHRDLKPSNVMVTLHDDKAVVKVIDFGVAKAMSDDLTEKTIYTRFYSMIGTPLYMSPEQAQMSGLDVDTRSDIYSLGVMLYELLVGTTPFERERLNSIGFDEMRQIIREEDPPLPSHRISTLGNRMTTVADARRTAPNRLTSTMRGDLDWIVMKALEKDRNRRYESASALARDLHRYLDQQPIEARPPSSFYQLSKFTRRHRTTLLTISLLVATLMLGTAASLWQMWEAIKERDQKETALQKALIAERNATEARQEIEQFASRLTQANLLIASGQAHAENELWSAAHQDLTDATSLQPSYYLPWVLRGQLYARLHLWNEAAMDYQQALELGAPVDEPQWWGVPAVFLLADNQAAFQQLHASNLTLLEDSQAKPRWNTLRSLLVAPSPPSKLASSQMALPELADSWLELTPPPPQRSFNDPFQRSRPQSPERKRPFSDGPNNQRPQGPKPPREFRRLPPQPDDLPPFVCDYISALAHLRAESNQVAAARFRTAENVRDWPARGIVDAPLAIALHRQGRIAEAQVALERSDETVAHWIAESSEMSTNRPSIPWHDFAEALVLHREATLQIKGTLPDFESQLEELRAKAVAKLTGNE